MAATKCRNLLLLLLLLLCAFIGVITSVSIGRHQFGTFWQLTDVHYDSNYSSPLLFPSLCQSAEGLRNSSQAGGGGNGGHFGDYNCDSPWSLVQSAVLAMRKAEPRPDFILWTGDSVSHVPDSATDLSKSLSLIKNVTAMLRKTFDDTPIYPVLGNHDTWPTDQMPTATDDEYYEAVLKETEWGRLLNSDQQQSFKKGGYYTARNADGLRLILINSNLWYVSNKKTEGQTDPADHFRWLENVLKEAHLRKERVLLSGHIPPGFFGRARNVSWLQPLFNRRLHSLLQQYADIIVATVFGHEHTDAFRLVYDNNDRPVVPMFIAPAVTPWFNLIPGVGSNNPAVRQYTYRRTPTHRVVDYVQYFVDLAAANVARRAEWSVEYRATTAFGVRDVGAASLSGVLSTMSGDDADARRLFDVYHGHNSVGWDTTPCRVECHTQHVCAAAEIDADRYADCLSGRVSVRLRLKPRDAGNDKPMAFVLAIPIVVVAVVVVLLVVHSGRVAGGRRDSGDAESISHRFPKYGQVKQA